MMTNKKEVAQAVKDAVGTVYKDDWCKKAGWEIDKPTIVVALRKVVAELQYHQFCWDEPVEHMVLDARAILDVCDEMEAL
jgi:hypothetical protein